MTDTDLINRMADEWAPTFGLNRHRPYSGMETLSPLFSNAHHERVRSAELEHRGAELLDHSRAFKALGGGNSLPVIMVSAPYENTLLRSMGTGERIVEEIYSLAEALGLRVRIGHPSDRIYDSSPPGHYRVLPIVWWDPARISLSYPPISAPQVEDHKE